MKKLQFLFLIAMVGSFQLFSNIIYVSPDGVDTNIGSIDSPLWSVQKAQEKAAAGDTVYIRGGEYIIQESDISKVESGIFACVSFLDKSGQNGKMINYWAYPGEQPIFNFSAVKPADQRVVGFWVKGEYLHFKGIEIIGIQVTITTHTESYGVYSYGSNNIFELLSIHDNVGTGLRHRNGGNNLFLNCDAYKNHDNVSENKKGSNSDGFGCHPKASGTGNVFKGCRAWFNSDDGYDIIRASAAVTFDSCWAFYNGYSPAFGSLADGNGFKAGGYGHDEEAKLPAEIPMNTIQFCLAVKNKANGFYSNHHLAGNYWYNNTGYQNQYNFNMVNRESKASDNINVNGYDHVLINNLSYSGRNGETNYIDATLCTLENNSFNNSDVTVKSDDFISLDLALLTAERLPNGKLPKIDLLFPKSSSDILDKGKDIGFPFLDSSPAVGAFEQEIAIVSVDIEQLDTRNYYVFPNPATDVISITGFKGSLSIVDLSGKEIMNKKIRDNKNISLSGISNGIYIVILNDNKNIIKHKLCISR